MHNETVCTSVSWQSVGSGEVFLHVISERKKNLPDEIKFGINVSERKVQKYSNLILHIKND